MAPHIEVTGTGAASAVPDTALLQVTVRCEGDDVAAALADCTARSNALVQAVRDHGVAERDVRTSSSGIQPRWDKDGQQVVGYAAHQSLRVAARDLARTGDLVEACAGAAGDALSVDSITLEVSDPAPLLRDARAAAFEDALAKAREYAAMAGRDLGKPVELTDVQVGGPVPRFAMAAKARADTMELAPGESSVSASVVVRWEWSDTDA